MMQCLVSLAVAEHFYSAVKLPPVFELACATPQAALYPADIGSIQLTVYAEQENYSSKPVCMEIRVMR